MITVINCFFAILFAAGAVEGDSNAPAGYPKSLQNGCFRLEGLKMHCGGRQIGNPGSGGGGGGGGGSCGACPDPATVRACSPGTDCDGNVCASTQPIPPLSCTYSKWVLGAGSVLVASDVYQTSTTCTPNQPAARDGCSQPCDCTGGGINNTTCDVQDLCPGQHPDAACSCTPSTSSQNITVTTSVSSTACYSSVADTVSQQTCVCNTPPPGDNQPAPTDHCVCGTVCPNP